MISENRDDESLHSLQQDDSADSLPNSPGDRDFSEQFRQTLTRGLASIPGHVCWRREGNVIVLSGSVRSFYSKQQAQEFVKSLNLHVTIENRCDVLDAPGQ